MRREAPGASVPLATYLRNATATRPSFDEQMKWVLRRRLPDAPGERYAYTKAAYLMLGAVVEEASGEPYASHCRNTTLAPLGARRDARFGEAGSARNDLDRALGEAARKVTRWP